MNIITKGIFCLVTLALLLCAAMPCLAQGTRAFPENGRPKTFSDLLVETGLTFNFPEEFKEVKAPNTESLPFNYGMELPGEGFEVWIRVSTLKESEKLLADKNIHVPSTDSLFVGLAQDQLTAFTSEKNYLRRNLPTYILRRYNANAGSTYLLNIDDTKLTKHYKYALLTVLQKNLAGVLIAICFTNEKGPGFFRNMNMAAGCLRFKE